MRQKTLDLPGVLLDRLTAEAKRRGITFGELARRLLDAGLDACGAPFPDASAISRASAEHQRADGPNAPAPAKSISTASVQHQPADAGEGGKGVGVLGWGKDSSKGNRREEEFCLTPPVDTPPRRTPARPRPRASPDPDFETFWEHYPRRVARPAAERAWEQAARDRPPLHALLSALSRQTAANRWTDPERLQYVPHASAWLNQRRWGDEVGVNGAAAALEAPDPWLVGIFDRYPPGPERDERILRASSGQISPADLARANRWDELRRNGGGH